MASLLCEQEADGETLLRSADIDWTSALLILSRYDATRHAFETARTTDHRLSVLMRGELNLEIRRSGVWRRGPMRSGSAIMIPGRQTQLMKKWNSRRPAVRPQIMHVFLPRELLSWAADRSRMPDGSDHFEATESPPFHDPAVAMVARSLLNAMQRQAHDPYAESTVQWLAMHLVSARSGGFPDEVRYPDVVADRNVARAIEYMSANLSEPMTLDT